ncbi:unnamed protein product [Prorocentrum cordatum]|uniref:Uncharacterized protein n=1 Tax=Prorocentrum cordatum TaxID=2364126 RepID=A0ABN9XIV6_9DINO|nr:unnamed protein product [Polarella glacialis]
MKDALRPLVDAGVAGARELARAGLHAGASWALLPSCPSVPPCPLCPAAPPCPACCPGCHCACGKAPDGPGAPGGGGGEPAWVGPPEAVPPCDALAAAVREVAERGTFCHDASWLCVAALVLGLVLGSLLTRAWLAGSESDGAGGAARLIPGCRVMVRYAEDDLWHERILLYPAASDVEGGACWVVLTPDGDVYIEELEGGSPDDSPVEWQLVARDLRLPPGLGRSYRFGEDQPGELRALYRRAYAASTADARSRGLQLAVPQVIRSQQGRDVSVEDELGRNFFGGRRVTGKQGVPAAGDALAAGAGAPGDQVEDGGDALAVPAVPNSVGGTVTPPPPGHFWRAAEPDSSRPIEVGDWVGTPSLALHDRGLFEVAPGRAIVVHLTALDKDAFAASLRPAASVGDAPGGGAAATGDARALPVRTGPRGRGREWRDVVDSSTSRRLDFLRGRRTPTDHHLMFKTTARLQMEQWGVQEHEQLMKYFELAGSYDQLDLSNCAFAEAILRRAQTIEWAYHDRLREADSASSKDKMSPEEFSALSGFSKAGDLLMVAPQLLEHVKAQVEKDAAIMKNIRKATEERELRRKGPKAGDGGGGNQAPSEGAVCRSVRRRLLRRDAVVQECNRVVGALNDLAGRPQAPSAPGLAERLLHRLVHERVRRAAVELGPPPPDLTPAGALRELRGASVCEDLDSPVVSFDDSLVSLPEAGNIPVPLGQLPQDVGDFDVEASMHEQLLRTEEAESNLLAAPRQPYMDTILRGEPRVYSRLVKRLADAGMVTYTDTPRERCGLFFVCKKSGKQRMVVDCRRANCWFQRPAAVALATASSLGELAVPEGKELYVGHVDICDAFYRFGLPEAFRGYFALPSVKAGGVGMVRLRERPLQPGSRVWPVLAVLPMGWSHALYWCQTVHRSIVSSIPELSYVPFIADKSVVPGLQPLAMTVCVDNLLALGTDPESARRAVALVNAALTQKGLPTHEVCMCDHNADILVWEIRGRECEIRPERSRLWRLRLALDCLVSRSAVGPRDVDKVLGHCTFVALLCREHLTIFNSVYSFVRRLRHCTAVPLWESVRWELNTFSSLLGMISRSMLVDWSPTVMCSDASFWGFGLVSKGFKEDLVGSVGSFSERWRFLEGSDVQSRAWAGVGEGPLESSRDFQDIVGSEEACINARQSAVSRLPAEFREKGWAVVGSHKWGGPPDNIVEGEARALAFGSLPTSWQQASASPPDGCPASGTTRTVRREASGMLDMPEQEAVALTRRRPRTEAVDAMELPRTRALTSPPAATAPRLRRLLDEVGPAGPDGSLPPLDSTNLATSQAVKRRKLARRLAKLTEEGSRDMLRRSTVRTLTARTRYQQLDDEFDEWMDEQGLPRRPRFSVDHGEVGPLSDADVKRIDLALAEWMLSQYLEGVDHWRGVQMLAALQWSDPRLGRDGSASLPAARQTLRGWKVLTPPRARLPLPEELVAAWEAAACAVLSMVFYMRPWEWGRVLVRHAVPPRAAGSLALRHWALLLRPREGEGAKASKTAEFDESMVLDLDCDQWLDFVNQLRPLREVKRRGRWKTDASVRRYERGGRLSEQFARLPGPLQRRALRCHSVLPEVLLGGLAAPPLQAC